MVPLALVRVLVDYRPALRARTGIGEYVHELVVALTATAPPDSRVAAFSASWRDRVADPLTREAPAVQIIDRHLPVRALTWAWHRLEWPPIEGLAGRWDVAHSPTPMLVPSRHAAQVVTVFDLHFLATSTDVSGVVQRDFVPLAPSHLARADHIIAGSGYAARLLEDRVGIERSRITTTPLGAPTWAAAVRRQRGDSLGAHVLFIGTLEPRKNLGLVLDAYAHLIDGGRPVPPLIVAGQPGPSAEAWQARAQRPPLAGHVTFTGYVDAARRETLYAHARALVVPSLDEGFGLPALEAMACGVPVIAAPVGALPDVVGDAGLLAPLRSTNAWADAIAAVLDDSRAGELARRGLVRAAAFSWTGTAVATWQAYAAAVEARAGRAG